MMRRVQKGANLAGSWLAIIIVIVLGGGCAGISTAPSQSYWQEWDVDAAWLEQRSRDQLLLVYLTADWCIPCKRLERETWADARVATWMIEHAVACKVDIDAQPEFFAQTELLGIPAVIAYRAGEEFDRQIGYLDADAMLSWLEDVRIGRPSVEKLRAALARVGSDDHERELDLREQLAVHYVHMREYEAAGQAFAWLLERRANPQVRARIDGQQPRMQLTARQSPAARAMFSEYRDSIVPDQGDAQSVQDWLLLSDVLDDRASVAQWLQRIVLNDALHDPLGTQYSLVVGAMVEHGLWDALLWYYDRPHFAPLPEIIESELHLAQSILNDEWRADARLRAAGTYAACLRAGREETAEHIAELLLRYLDDASSRQWLVQKALQAGEARPVHRRWLNAAVNRGADVHALQRELREALQGRSS